MIIKYVCPKMTHAIDRNLIECKQFNSPLKVMLVSRIFLALFTKDKLVRNFAKHGSFETSTSFVFFSDNFD